MAESNFPAVFSPMILARLFSRANATIISAALAVWRFTRSVTRPWNSLRPNPSVSSTMGVLAIIAGANFNASIQSAFLEAGMAWNRLNRCFSESRWGVTRFLSKANPTGSLLVAFE